MLLEGNEVRIERIKEAVKEVKKQGVLIKIWLKNGEEGFYVLRRIRGNNMFISHLSNDEGIFVLESVGEEILKDMVKKMNFFTAEGTLEIMLSFKKRIQSLKKT